MHIRSFCISGVPGITVSVFQMGGAGIRRVVIIPLGYLFFQCVQNMLCIIPPGSNGCARAALCRLESCFYAGGHWGVCFCKRGSVCRVQKGLLQGVLCDPGLAIFSIVLWGSALSCFLKPGRSFRGCFCVWCAFARLCCFTGGSCFLEGSKTGRSSFHNLGHLGLCTFIGRLADGGGAIWVLMGKVVFYGHVCDLWINVRE